MISPPIVSYQLTGEIAPFRNLLDTAPTPGYTQGNVPQISTLHQGECYGCRIPSPAGTASRSPPCW